MRKHEPKRYFSQVYSNPYFHSHYYQEETFAGKTESKIEKFLFRFKFFFKINKNK